MYTFVGVENSVSGAGDDILFRRKSTFKTLSKIFWVAHFIFASGNCLKRNAFMECLEYL